MNVNKQTRELLISHYEKYPDLEAQDLFKFVFHSAFGCDHIVSSLENAVSYIEEEYKSVLKKESPLIEELDGDYVRVHLSYLNTGLTARSLGKIFCLSAKIEKDGMNKLSEKLEAVRSLIVEGIIRLDINEFDEALDEWRKLGFTAVRHSETFRAKYSPAYRVISKKYARHLPILAQIDKDLGKRAIKVLVTNDEREELSDVIKSVYGAAVLTADNVLYVIPSENKNEPTGIVN
ncbi:MAG: hypothetical protein IJ404_02615 [Clostridia bacterium]|nr:hypothetical protein [Clostridia bacterium]